LAPFISSVVGGNPFSKGHVPHSWLDNSSDSILIITLCGRFTLTVKEEELRKRFQVEMLDLKHIPRYNISPSQNIPVVVHQDKIVLKGMRWGLIPFWAKDEKIGYKMINARVETIAEKVSFKRSLQKRRCPTRLEIK